jgi:hypothetical protein
LDFPVDLSQLVEFLSVDGIEDEPRHGLLCFGSLALEQELSGSASEAWTPAFGSIHLRVALELSLGLLLQEGYQSSSPHLEVGQVRLHGVLLLGGLVSAPLQDMGDEFGDLDGFEVGFDLRGLEEGLVEHGGLLIGFLSHEVGEQVALH